MNQETNLLFTKFQTLASFIEPEISKMNESTIHSRLNSEPGLNRYMFYLNDLMRRKIYTFSDEVEKVIAEAGRVTNSQSSIYNTFINTEFVHTEVKLSTGEIIKLDPSSFRRFRRIPDQEDRELVYKTFYGELNKYRSTFGALMNAKIHSDLFNARARGYGSCLQMILHPDNIPESVFHNLIATANKNLDIFHRYMNIRKRLLGVDALKYTDLSLPPVQNVDVNYHVEEAMRIIVESLEPLGDTYTSIVEKAFGSRWIDFYPTPGKRSGAYNDFGAYAEHPYILMNYAGRYDSVSTLIHELGHSIHQYLTDRNQPYITSNFSALIAEVASLFNERLLRASVLKKIKDDDLKLSLLMDTIERTIFDQAQISEFELKIHQEAEKGNVLSGDTISGIYLDTLRKYYGHDRGVCAVPDFVDMQWIFDRLLFIRTYRIYVYAASQTAAMALTGKVLPGEKGAAEKYLDFLSSGGSDYPVNILKNAGVDMTASEPFEKTMESLTQTLDEIERIIGKRESGKKMRQDKGGPFKPIGSR